MQKYIHKRIDNYTIVAFYWEYSRYRYLYFYHREELGAGSIFIMQLIDEINHIAHAQTGVSQ
jgi:hypothetical protein